jgi:hypothetical protein
MKWIMCLVLFALTGCSSVSNGPVILKLIEDQNFTAPAGSSVQVVRWVRVPFDRLQTICGLSSNMPHAKGRFLGCAGKDLGGTCIIHTSTDTTHQILGHELRHCFQGNFHK